MLADIIGSGAVPVVRLTEVFRQAAAEPDHRQRPPHQSRARCPSSAKPERRRDFYFVEAEDPETAVPGSSSSCKTRIPARFGLDPMRDIQVLCPMNRGGVGARSLNIELQAALNPTGETKVERFGWTFAPGDKVMQIENDYDSEVYNGDHRLRRADRRRRRRAHRSLRWARRSSTASANSTRWSPPTRRRSTSARVGISGRGHPAPTQHYTMLQRNLLYTGVTRGKRLVVLVGQPKAVAIAVRNASGGGGGRSFGNGSGHRSSRLRSNPSPAN